MRRSLPLLAVPALISLLLAAAASAHRSAPTRSAASIEACALLPDTTSSTRYQLFDKPYLEAAFKAANVSATVLNAQGSAQTQRSQGDQCLTQGAKVILLDALDSATGASIESAADAKNVKVIDYDRLVLNGKAAYYVSFNNVTVGKTMGKGLVAALKAKGKYSKHPVIAELNGGITENNATLFKQGYDSILKPLYAKGTFKKAKSGDQWTDWDPIKGRRIFDQILVRNGNKIDASIAANDGLAGAVIASLKAHGLKPIPLTGQDATPTGVQFILAGWQSGTVYKSEQSAVGASLAAPPPWYKAPVNSTAAPTLELREVSKSFGAVQALDAVNFEVRDGEVMALVGDNGAGKSTLIKCVAGIYSIDSGQVLFDGRPVTIHGPKDAAKLGIEVVYQDLALCENLDVVQNMYLGRETRDWLYRLNEPAMEQRTAETLKSLAVTPIRSIRQPVASLSGGQRQSVAVAKAVQWNSRLVILDEPTAALGVAQTEQVLALVKRLAERGLAVVLISHNLHDIFEVATRITVLRLGHDVGVYERAKTTKKEVVHAITAGAPTKVSGIPEAAGTA